MDTNEQTNEELFGSLTTDEARTLRYLGLQPDRAGFIRDSKTGGVITQLERKGLVRKFGKVGLYQRWQMVSDKFTRSGMDFLSQIIDSEVLTR